jgi:hypothetical protein
LKKEEENMQKGEREKAAHPRREFLKEAALLVSGSAAASTMFATPRAYGMEPGAGPSSVAPAKIELTLLSPLGVIDPPPMLGITPRLATLDGKKLAMIHNNKAGAKEFLIALEELLKAKYPSATFTHFDTNINLADKPEKYAEMAQSCDAFILGSGD